MVLVDTDCVLLSAMASLSPAQGLCLYICICSLLASAAPHKKNITHLPGFDGPLPFSLQTGYVEVDEENGVRLFYYFIQSERKPQEDPLLLWLMGGPGCSGFSGLIYEIGPLSFDIAGYTDGLPNLVYRPYAWTKVSNVIFLDSPIGTGFSYSTTEGGFKSSDTKTVKQLLIFLKKWLKEHSEFMSNPLYVGGESYSGYIVPTVAFEIARDIQVRNQPVLNLKGYLVGNPFTDGKFDSASKVPFAHGMGLISDKLYEVYKKSCSEDNNIKTSVECEKCVETINKCLGGISELHILEPKCALDSPHPYEDELNLERRSSVLLDYTTQELLRSPDISPTCRTAGHLISYAWANNDTVREALGIHKGTVPSWRRCNRHMPYTRDIKSSLKYHLDLTSRGYQSLVYSGDHDMAVPYIGTQAWVKSLNLSIVDDWRSWHVDGQVAGFTRAYSNGLTFATLKGGGHTAPEYMPKECLAMVSRWFSGNPL